MKPSLYYIYIYVYIIRQSRSVEHLLYVGERGERHREGKSEKEEETGGGGMGGDELKYWFP